MRTRTTFLVVATFFAAFILTINLQAQPLVNIETVLVDDPGNPPDSTGYGSVAYAYRIGKFEVTIGQYTAFLNSVAKSDPYGLYFTDGNFANLAGDPAVAGIARTNSPNFYRYSAIAPAGLTPAGASSASNRPVAYISWFAAARFCNWLHNGATNGADTETGAYTLNGAVNGLVTRNTNARWWIPSEDEWYKAAYYRDRDAGYWFYPTQSYVPPSNFIGSAANQANTYFWRAGAPYFSVTQSSFGDTNQNYLTEVGAFANSPSRFGTFDQAGNLAEWTEGVKDVFVGSRVYRGGAWDNYVDAASSSDRRDNMPHPAYGNRSTGFRVATTADWVAPQKAVITLQKAANLSSAWQNLPITSGMMTPDGEIIVGALTNTNEFYRLKIRAVVE